jgi:hypothetical protein
VSQGAEFQGGILRKKMAKKTKKATRIELRRGGWFVFYEQILAHHNSGPWKTEEAAKLAAEGKFHLAHRAERGFCPF